MSTVNVWLNGAWTLVDIKGPVGDAGAAGPAGTNQLTVNGMEWGQTATNPADGNIEPTALTVVGSASADPCMTVVSGGRLSANKAGMYAVSFTTWYPSIASPTDGGNWLIVQRVVADAGGLKQLATADITRGDNIATATGVFWLALNEVIQLIVGKSTGGANTNVQYYVRAVMFQ